MFRASDVLAVVVVAVVALPDWAGRALHGAAADGPATCFPTFASCALVGVPVVVIAWVASNAYR
jgi:hypothetical protein